MKQQIGIDKLISSMWDFNDPAATETRFAQWLEIEGVAAPLADQLAVQTQIARTQGLRGEFDAAMAVLDAVEAQLTADMTAVKTRWLLEKGRVFNSSGHPNDAAPLFTQAFDLASKSDLERLAIDAAHMMGIVAPPDEQLVWSLRTLELVEASSDSTMKGWLGPLYNNIGWTYYDAGDYNEAMDYFQKGLDWRESVNDEQGARIARWTVGRCLRSQGRNDEALVMQTELEREIRENELSPDGYVFQELGELHMLNDDEVEAAKWFALAYEQLSQDQWTTNNEPERLARLKKLGGL